MTFEQFKSRYQEGRMADGEFVNQIITYLTSNNVDVILGSIPDAVLDDFKQHIEEFEPGSRVLVFGEARQWTLEQVNLAKSWLKRREEKKVE